MATIIYVMLGTVLLFCACADIAAFTVNRRSSGDQNRLLDALEVIERERRRLASDDDITPYWPAEDRRSGGRGYAQTGGERYPAARLVGLSRGAYADGGVDTDDGLRLGPAAREAPPAALTDVDVQAMFTNGDDSDGDDTDDNSDATRSANYMTKPDKRTRQRLLKKSAEQKSEKRVLKDINLSPQLVADLLASVKQTEEESQHDDLPNSTIVPASDDELSSVLNDGPDTDGDSDGDSDDDNGDEVIKTDAENYESNDKLPPLGAGSVIESVLSVKAKTPFYSNKELFFDLNSHPSKTERLDRKRKRSNVNPALTYDGVDINKIMKLIKMEDEENNNLARALNLATKSQLQGTEEYIPEEIKYIRNAIEAEGAMLRLAERSASHSPSYPARNEEVTLKRKREDPIEPPNVEYAARDAPEVNEYLIARWLQRYLENRAPADVTKEMSLNPFLRKLIAKYQEFPKNKRSYLRQESNEGYFGHILKRDATPDISGNQLAELDALNPYLDSPESEANEMPTDLYELPSGDDRSECAVIPLLTDNCGVARASGIALDRQAADLCNRHQLCYACGAAHGIAKENCDDGYLNEAGRFCRFEKDQSSCEHDAVQFFLIIALAHEQVAAPSTKFACRAACVRDYIVSGE